MADDRQTTGETGGTGATGVSLAGPARPASPKPETNMTSDEMLNRAREVFDIEIEGLRRTRESLGESFTKAVELMLRCVSSEGIIVVTGVGKNLAVAEKISAIFASTGTRSIVLNPVQAMHGDLGMVAPRDVLLALSFSGESDEILRLIPAIRRHGLKVISLTGRPESNLAAMSDIHVEIPCGKEACPFGMAPTNSTTATMAMGDALAMVMLDAMKFDVSSYAMNHPAGAIGRALVLKVTDVMRTGERMASVAPEATVMDAKGSCLASSRTATSAVRCRSMAGLALPLFPAPSRILLALMAKPMSFPAIRLLRVALMAKLCLASRSPAT